MRAWRLVGRSTAPRLSRWLLGRQILGRQILSRRWARWSLALSALLLLIPAPVSGPAGRTPVIGSAHAHVHQMPAATDREAPAGGTTRTPTVTTATSPAVPVPLSRVGWTVAVDGQELVGENGAAANVIDDDPTTYWHSRWTSTVAPMPHWLTIDMKTPSLVGGLIYQPRPAPDRNGNIGRYEVHVSANGTSWGSPVATGTFADDSLRKSVAFVPVTTRFVRLTALTEAGERGQFTSAAEVHLGDEHSPAVRHRSGRGGRPGRRRRTARS